MARKDNRGRNLKTGETQRADGRYLVFIIISNGVILKSNKINLLNR